MNRFALTLSTSAILFLFVGIAAGQPLQWKLVKNDKFIARIIQETTVATVGGFASTQNLLYDVSTDWRVTEINANRVATVQISIASIRVKIDNDIAPNFAVDVDTRKTAPTTDPSKTFSKHMQSLMGKTFLMRVTPTGKVSHLPLPTETKKTIDAFPKTDYVLQTFHIESIIQSMTSYFVEFPRNLAAGNTWSTQSDTKTPANESFVSTTTYEGLNEINKIRLAQFTFKSDPKLAGDRKVSKEAREPFMVSKQTGSGVSLFDPKSGNFTNAIYRNEIDSTTEFEGTKSGTRIVSDFKVTLERVAVQ